MKQEALRATAEMFRTSGEELGKVVKRAEGEWEVALGVRERGGYAVGLRGVERGFMGGDRKRDARDWIGWYGLDAGEFGDLSFHSERDLNTADRRTPMISSFLRFSPSIVPSSPLRPPPGT